MTISKTNYNCNRLFLFLFLFFVNYLTISAVEKRTIHVATAGTLPNYISESEKYSIEELTLTGELNAVDFSLLRDMAGNDSEGTGSPGKLEILDISQVTMIRGEEKFVNSKQIKWSSYPLSHDILSTGVNGDATIKDSYSIPAYLFAGCTSLKHIILPLTISSIGQRAFFGCPRLEIIDIPNSVNNIASSALGDHETYGTTWWVKQPDGLVYAGKVAYDYKGEMPENTIIELEPGTKGIAAYAFDKCRGMSGISIPESVTIIGECAFQNCSGLASVVIPNTVTSIGRHAFYGTAWYNSLPDGLVYAGKFAYKYKGTMPENTEIEIKDGTKGIAGSAFSGCSGLTSITIPNSVTSIGDYVFDGCNGLTSIMVSSGNSKYDSRNDCNAIIETSSNTLIAGCMNTVIPNSVTSIGNYAFFACSDLTSITIPNSVTSINYRAFSYCKGLTSIMIPNSVMNIGDGAFEYCNGLTSITIPTSVKSIGGSAFWGCSGLTSIMIPNSVTNIGIFAFKDCKSLTSITIPNSVKNIANYVFSDCNGLTTVISEINNPFETKEGVFSSETYSDATLIVPKGTKSAYQSTKYWNKFSNIVESTNENQGTKRTIHVATAGTLPNYISDSEKYTIEELTLTGELNGTDFRLLRDMAGNNYLGKDTEGKLRILDFSGAKIVAGGEKYLDANGISVNYGVIMGSFHYVVTNNNEVPEYVFCACDLEKVRISNTATSIGDDAFKDCSGLTSITIPNSVTGIGNWAFNSCSGLTSITIPNSVTSIGNGAFYHCSGLTSISIPNSVTGIGRYAFNGCSGLTSITVSNGNTKYDSRNNCNAIIETSSNTLIAGCKNTVIPNSVTSIGHDAFYDCSSLTSITIPNSVTSIGHSAFNGCSGLTSITIPNSVTSIGRYAFYDCSSLTSISIPNSVTSIGDYAFNGCSGLKDIVSEIQTPFEIDESVFSVYSTAKLTVPKGTKSAYQSKKYWNKFSNIVESGDSQESVTVTAKSYTREYGDANPTFEYMVSGGSISGTPKITCSATKTSAVGSYTIKIEKGSVTNSNVTFVNGTLTITKAPLTITAKSYTRKQGEANPTFEVTYKGFKNNETESVLSKKPTVSTTATTNSSPGTYTITVSGAEAKNYSITYVNGTLTVTQKDLAVFTLNGIKYAETGTSKKVEVQSVDNNLLNVDIPSSVAYNGVTYQVTSVSNSALSGRVFNYVSFPSTITSLKLSALSGTILGAMIWNADASLSNNLFGNCSMVTDANFLLYVNSKAYAPSNVKNVIVGSSASEIVLKDAQDTWFYCPREFTAQNISYTHHYGMTTGGNGKGWETISLPFIVQRIEHKTKGGLTPFASYDASSSQRPFWLYEMGGNGFSRTGTIQANTPYIISMPNSANYDNEYILSGDVTFSATNAKVKETSSLVTATSNGKRFVPAFSVVEKASGIYPLNVNNNLVSYNGTYEAGSRFIGNLRKVYPFEAYMTTSSNTRAVIDIEFDNETTGFGEALFLESANTTIEVYTIGGQRVAKVSDSDYQELWQSLPSGVYVVNGKKMIK